MAYIRGYAAADGSHWRQHRSLGWHETLASQDDAQEVQAWHTSNNHHTDSPAGLSAYKCNRMNIIEFPVEELHGSVPSDKKEYDLTDLFERLSKSGFRSRFHLSRKDRDYIIDKGLPTIRKHAEDFVAKRLAPAVIPNDGKQTPMRGHPVFIAQHATGCCCRDCFFKWHQIPAGRELTKEEQDYAVAVLMAWIDKQMQEDEG